MSDHERLIKLARDVKAMRDIQKRFFGGERSAAVVRDAKQIERHVDRLVAEILDDRPGLNFGGDDA